MANISIIGTGNMGTAIGDIATKGGHSVQLIGHADVDKQVSGDLVVLAVPHPALTEIVESRGDQLAGKVVVDITNPLNFETFDSLVVPADGSAAAELAQQLPQSKVLKAFNTNFAATLATGSVGDQQPTTVLVAGDDDDAKAALTDVVTSGGLKVVDAGALNRARELEAIGFLQLTLAAGEKLPWTAGFAVVS